MPNDLFSLFDDRLKNDRDLVASDPQTLETIAGQTEEQDRILAKLRGLQEVEPKIDYSDFSNFVFFNSALDYFNITGEKILNDYPYDGSVADLENFTNALDGYQRYVLKNWPSRSGHLRFNPATSASYVKIEDVGVQDGISRSTFISPGTGSLSVEFWMNVPGALTGANDVMVVAQKVTGSGDGFTVYLSGSQIYFKVVSGSVSEQISTRFSTGAPSFYSCVLDRSTSSPTYSIMTGSSTTFPVTAVSGTSTITSQMYLGPTAFTMASGTLTGKVTRPFTGSLDQVALWSVPRLLTDLTSSFNTKLHAQSGLLALWRFNESGSIRNNQPANAVVFDHSGHRLNGRIQNYYSGIRGSGSIMPNDVPDPILLIDAPEVQSLIYQQQTSGSDYDRSNDNMITNLLPEAFFRLEEYNNTEVLKNFVYILARQFDYIKQRIDHFVYLMRSNYGEFNQTPDALLAEIGRFFGWEFTGNFLNADAFQYIIGRNILKNVDANQELEKKLYEIKNEFWRRTLINLMYLYKTKGTRESIESLFRVYGVNKNFVKLKEYGYRPNVGIQTNRIHAEKSAYALAFGTGSNASSNIFVNGVTTKALAFEAHVRFPTADTSNMTSTIQTGSLAAIVNASAPNNSYEIVWEKQSVSSTTGSLKIVTGDSTNDITLSNIPIFDGNWYNIALLRNPLSGTYGLDVRRLDRDTIVAHYSSSAVPDLAFVSASSDYGFLLGRYSFPAEFWVNEVRLWDNVLNDGDLQDHALNFQSYGTEDPSVQASCSLHLRLNDATVGTAFGLNPLVRDVLGRYVMNAGSFNDGQTVSQRFLFDYNYIAAPDFSWNEDKVRVLEGSEVKPADAYTDNQLISLEFNMIDALNEDISQIMSTMDSFNNAIGLPANRYRGTYFDLGKIRKQYFSRLQGDLNFRVFADMLEFFDRSFIDMVAKLIPARAIFVGDEFVVESHMLERPKLQWNHRRQDVALVIEGAIKIISRG